MFLVASSGVTDGGGKGASRPLGKLKVKKLGHL